MFGPSGGKGRTHLADLLVVEVIACLGKALHGEGRADDDDHKGDAKEGGMLAQGAVHRVAIQRGACEGRHPRRCLDRRSYDSLAKAQRQRSAIEL